ncbi:hypothetical protein OF83DRAFT_531030 [Amylostereum chailletii]|nr:hypothetical protein OF83DRAFT_531030 [Amylostereum chailletii]
MPYQNAFPPLVQTSGSIEGNLKTLCPMPYTVCRPPPETRRPGDNSVFPGNSHHRVTAPNRPRSGCGFPCSSTCVRFPAVALRDLFAKEILCSVDGKTEEGRYSYAADACVFGFVSSAVRPSLENSRGAVYSPLHRFTCLIHA